MYYNYHARARQLIAEGHLVGYEYFDNWNGIAPALVLFFDNHSPMPIRKHKWNEYSMLKRNTSNS
jgi:hypothetical protein